jgi:hypothetical protein
MNWQQFKLIQTRRDFSHRAQALAWLYWRSAQPTADGMTACLVNRWRECLISRRSQACDFYVYGGPQPVRIFDPKLSEVPGSALLPLTKDLKLAFINPGCDYGHKFKFQRYGQSGTELSELLPHLGSCADDLCLVRSMHTDAFNHHPGQFTVHRTT